MVPFLIREMDTNYALVLIFLTFGSLAQLMGTGISQSLVREFAAALGNRDSKVVNNIANSGLVLYLALSVIFSLIFFLLSPFLLNSFWKDGTESEIFACRLYGVCTIVVGFVSESWIGLVAAHQRFDVINGLKILGQVVVVALLFILIPSSDRKLFTWVMVTVSVPIITNLALFIAAKRINSKFVISFSLARISRIKDILGLSIRVTFLQISRFMSERSDPLILAAFLRPISVVVYNSAGKIPVAGRPFITTIAQQLSPQAAQMHVTGKRDQLRQILMVGTRYSMLLGSGVFLAIFFLSEEFCFLWLGDKLPTEWMLIAELMIGMALIDLIDLAAGGTQWSILIGLRKLKFQMWTMIPSAVINLCLSIFLVSSTNLGVKGVIVATFLIAAIRRPLMIWYTGRLVELKMTEYLKSSYLAPVLVLGLSFALSSVIMLISFPSGWVWLCLRAMLIFVCWGSLCWFLGVSRAERENLKRRFQKERRRVSSQ